MWTKRGQKRHVDKKGQDFSKEKAPCKRTESFSKRLIQAVFKAYLQAS